MSADWATVTQVHGARAVAVTGPGDHGQADALVTDTSRLPVAVFTADCLGVVIECDGAVGVAHGGWRGLDAGVLEGTCDALMDLGYEPIRATAGPAIRSCCFEVGPDVAAAFPDHVRQTSWGSTSVDLLGVAAERLGMVPLTVEGGCTRCSDGYFSHRATATPDRLAVVAWVQ